MLRAYTHIDAQWYFSYFYKGSFQEKSLCGQMMCVSKTLPIRLK